ncbi:MAG: YihY family inner membrane protein [Chloroflexota bacterium]|nr:YihY family inner membrane protein [Chloroflexota bacterium]
MGHAATGHQQAAGRSEAGSLAQQATGWNQQRGVRALLLQSIKDLKANNAPEWAAALAFYTLLSLFPLLLAGATVASYFVDASWAVDRITQLLGEFVPRGEIEVEQIVDGAIAERGRVGLLSVVVLLATGRRVLGALVKALNLMSDVDERKDSLIRRALLELGLLFGLGGLILLALSARPLLSPVWSALDVLPGPLSLVARPALVIVRGLLLLATFYLIYAIIPRGERVRKAALIGAIAATLLFLLARVVFLFFTGHLWANFNLIYGPLAVAAILMLWAWYVALITLFGASLASHAKTMLIEDQTAAEAASEHVERKVPHGG